jgi:signal transduction histidine kinase
MPAIITADGRKLKQIIYNLLSNAIKFTPEGGMIKLSAKWVTSCEGKHIEIAVKDSGIGLKCEDLERIFRPFEQVDNSASRRYQGSGLGLTLTKRFVELHGGSIRVESEGEGEGCTFRLSLPIS